MNAPSFDQPTCAREESVTPSEGVSGFVGENGAKLEILAALLDSLPDDTYASPNEPASSASLGAHVRHVLDFYSCLIRGAVGGTVDYEHRDRNPEIEVDRRAALAQLNSLRGQLHALAEGDDRPLELLVVDLHGVERRGRTSLLRELEAALSHSVHHFAIIAVLLRLRGIEPPADFGVAPSTLRYLRGLDARR